MMEEDSDLAYSLQLEEALAASLHDGAVSAPTSSYPAPVSDLFQPDDILPEYELDLLDKEAEAVAVAESMRLDLSRQIHDRALACELANLPEEEWKKLGDNLNRPYGEGSSSSGVQGLAFRVYVKGLVGGLVGAVGVAICDGSDGLVFELSKCFALNEKEAKAELVEVKALIEGLEVAVMLDLKRVTIFSSNPVIHQFVTGKNPPMTANVATLSNQINRLLRKFTHTSASLVPHEDVKFAFELARNAMVVHIDRLAGNSNRKNKTEICSICFEKKYVDQMFLIMGCRHSYCFSCMSKHIQFKLLQGILPKCPSEKCKYELKLDSCKKFLTPELFDIMSQRLKEASIPAAEKIYCPFPRCSTLLSKNEVQGSMRNSNFVLEELGARKCPRCSGIFCISCRVPWHNNMMCSDFKRLNPYPCKEDKKLKSLAAQNLWRQCPKCNHMVSLVSGCYHIYCRCGHEFCYTCGAEWKKKKPTCTCPIWDERNILYNERNRRRR